MSQKQLLWKLLLRKQNCYRAVVCVATRTSNRVLQIRAVRKLREVLNAIRLQMYWCMCISDTNFCIDALSEEECCRQYRFMKSDVLKLNNIFCWTGSTQRNKYKCSPFTVTYIVLCRLAYPCIWKTWKSSLVCPVQSSQEAEQISPPSLASRRPPKWGSVANTPKGDEATVDTQPQREHRHREGCSHQRGWEEEKRVSFGSPKRQEDHPGGDQAPQ